MGELRAMKLLAASALLGVASAAATDCATADGLTLCGGAASAFNCPLSQTTDECATGNAMYCLDHADLTTHHCLNSAVAACPSLDGKTSACTGHQLKCGTKYCDPTDFCLAKEYSGLDADMCLGATGVTAGEAYKNCDGTAATFVGAGTGTTSAHRCSELTSSVKCGSKFCPHNDYCLVTATSGLSMDYCLTAAVGQCSTGTQCSAIAGTLKCGTAGQYCEDGQFCRVLDNNNGVCYWLASEITACDAPIDGSAAGGCAKATKKVMCGTGTDAVYCDDAEFCLDNSVSGILASNGVDKVNYCMNAAIKSCATTDGSGQCDAALGELQCGGIYCRDNQYCAVAANTGTLGDLCLDGALQAMDSADQDGHGNAASFANGKIGCGSIFCANGKYCLTAAISGYSTDVCMTAQRDVPAATTGLAAAVAVGTTSKIYCGAVYCADGEYCYTAANSGLAADLCLAAPLTACSAADGSAACDKALGQLTCGAVQCEHGEFCLTAANSNLGKDICLGKAAAACAKQDGLLTDCDEVEGQVKCGTTGFCDHHKFCLSDATSNIGNICLGAPVVDCQNQDGQTNACDTDLGKAKCGTSYCPDKFFCYAKDTAKGMSKDLCLGATRASCAATDGSAACAVIDGTVMCGTDDVCDDGEFCISGATNKCVATVPACPSTDGTTSTCAVATGKVKCGNSVCADGKYCFPSSISGVTKLVANVVTPVDQCLGAQKVACSKTDGTGGACSEANGEVVCGSIFCDGVAGEICLVAATSSNGDMCLGAAAAACDSTAGASACDATAGKVKCGTAYCKHGQFCYDQTASGTSTDMCYDAMPACPALDGSVACAKATAKVGCGAIVCADGEFCLAKSVSGLAADLCLGAAAGAVTPADGTTAAVTATGKMLCGAIYCEAGEYCLADATSLVGDMCLAAAAAACPNTAGTTACTLTGGAVKCGAKYCAAGEFCVDTTASGASADVCYATVPACPSTDGTTKCDGATGKLACGTATCTKDQYCLTKEVSGLAADLCLGAAAKSCSKLDGSAACTKSDGKVKCGNRYCEDAETCMTLANSSGNGDVCMSATKTTCKGTNGGSGADCQVESAQITCGAKTCVDDEFCLVLDSTNGPAADQCMGAVLTNCAGSDGTVACSAALGQLTCGAKKCDDGEFCLLLDGTVGPATDLCLGKAITDCATDNGSAVCNPVKGEVRCGTKYCDATDYCLLGSVSGTGVDYCMAAVLSEHSTTDGTNQVDKVAGTLTCGATTCADDKYCLKDSSPSTHGDRCMTSAVAFCAGSDIGSGQAPYCGAAENGFKCGSTKCAAGSYCVKQGTAGAAADMCIGAHITDCPAGAKTACSSADGKVRCGSIICANGDFCERKTEGFAADSCTATASYTAKTDCDNTATTACTGAGLWCGTTVCAANDKCAAGSSLALYGTSQCVAGTPVACGTGNTLGHATDAACTYASHKIMCGTGASAKYCADGQFCFIDDHATLSKGTWCLGAGIKSILTDDTNSNLKMADVSEGKIICHTANKIYCKDGEICINNAVHTGGSANTIGFATTHATEFCIGGINPVTGWGYGSDQAGAITTTCAGAKGNAASVCDHSMGQIQCGNKYCADGYLCLTDDGLTNGANPQCLAASSPVTTCDVTGQTACTLAARACGSLVCNKDQFCLADSESGLGDQCLAAQVTSCAQTDGTTTACTASALQCGTGNYCAASKFCLSATTAGPIGFKCLTHAITGVMTGTGGTAADHTANPALTKCGSTGTVVYCDHGKYCVAKATTSWSANVCHDAAVSTVGDAAANGQAGSLTTISSTLAKYQCGDSNTVFCPTGKYCILSTLTGESAHLCLDNAVQACAKVDGTAQCKYTSVTDAKLLCGSVTCAHNKYCLADSFSGIGYDLCLDVAVDDCTGTADATGACAIATGRLRCGSIFCETTHVCYPKAVSGLTQDYCLGSIGTSQAAPGTGVALGNCAATTGAANTACSKITGGLTCGNVKCEHDETCFATGNTGASQATHICLGPSMKTVGKGACSSLLGHQPCNARFGALQCDTKVCDDGEFCLTDTYSGHSTDECLTDAVTDCASQIGNGTACARVPATFTYALKCGATTCKHGEFCLSKVESGLATDICLQATKAACAGIDGTSSAACATATGKVQCGESYCNDGEFCLTAANAGTLGDTCLGTAISSCPKIDGQAACSHSAGTIKCGTTFCQHGEYCMHRSITGEAFDQCIGAEVASCGSQDGQAVCNSTLGQLNCGISYCLDGQYCVASANNGNNGDECLNNITSCVSETGEGTACNAALGQLTCGAGHCAHGEYCFSNATSGLADDMCLGANLTDKLCAAGDGLSTATCTKSDGKVMCGTSPCMDGTLCLNNTMSGNSGDFCLGAAVTNCPYKNGTIAACSTVTGQVTCGQITCNTGEFCLENNVTLLAADLCIPEALTGCAGIDGTSAALCSGGKLVCGDTTCEPNTYCTVTAGVGSCSAIYPTAAPTAAPATPTAAPTAAAPAAAKKVEDQTGLYVGIAVGVVAVLACAFAMVKFGVFSKICGGGASGEGKHKADTGKLGMNEP